MNAHLDAQLQLQRSIAQAEKSALWLSRSLHNANKINITEALSENDFDVLENLTSRFARLCDILFQKVFRAIDLVELESAGTLIDVINRAAKRGIIGSDLEARELRELRNVIAHEYSQENLVQVFNQVRDRSADLLKILQKTKEYVSKRSQVLRMDF